MTRQGPFRPQRRVDVRMLSVAVILLCCVGFWWLTLSGNATRERERIRSTVPAFPQRPAVVSTPPQTSIARAAPGRNITSSQLTASPIVQRFILNSGKSGVAGMVHLNALLNAPFVRKLNQCFDTKELEGAADGGSGFQPQRDIDEVSFTDDGMLATGFFDGTPESAGFHCPQSGDPESYRGFTIYHCASHVAYAGQQSAIIEGSDNIKTLIDRATDAPPADADPGDIYGDMYWRMDTSDMGQTPGADMTETMIDAALAQLTNVRIRANVWDSVALSAEARPSENQTAQDAATSLQGVLGLVRSQINENDVETSTFAELAQVSSDGARVHMNLALPADMLADKLNNMCAESKKKRASRVKDPEPEEEEEQAAPGE